MQQDGSSLDEMTDQVDTSSDDREPAEKVFAVDWQVNPALIKGVALAGAGLFTLLVPDLSAVIIRYCVAAALVVFGLADLWGNIRSKDKLRWGELLLAAAATILGVFLLLFQVQAFKITVIALGFYLFGRGVVAGLRLIFRRSSNRILDMIACGAQLSLGIIMIALPETIIQSLLGAVALTALLIGLITVAYSQSQKAQDADIDVSTLATISRSWLRTQDIGDEQRNHVAEDLYFEPPAARAKLGAWWVMLLLSVAIATYGVLQDSTAVVIGAMLIAPLMVPIVGCAAAIVNGRKARAARSILLVGEGVVAAILLAFIIGKWSPILVPLEANSQVLSRVSPNVVDMAIALAAGAAGGFAMINPRVASGLAGVAIAVALVPPLAVVGLMLETASFEDALGAFLLFLTNLVSILLSAALVFGLSGWTSIDRIQSQAASIALTMGVVLAAAMIILLPLLFTSQGVLAEGQMQTKVTTTTNKWFDENEPEAEVTLVTVKDGVASIEAEGPDPIQNAQTLADEINAELSQPVEVKITYTPTQEIIIPAPAEEG